MLKSDLELQKPHFLWPTNYEYSDLGKHRCLLENKLSECLTPRETIYSICF